MNDSICPINRRGAIPRPVSAFSKLLLQFHNLDALLQEAVSLRVIKRTTGTRAAEPLNSRRTCDGRRRYPRIHRLGFCMPGTEETGGGAKLGPL